MKRDAQMYTISEKIVVNRLRQESKNWYEPLSVAEKKALKKYTYNSFEQKHNRFFERLNTMLRGNYNKADAKKLEKYAEIISSAIYKYKLHYPLTCYRGVDIDTTNGFVIGTEFTFKQFISTTVIRSKAFSTKYLYIIYVQPMSQGAYIELVSKFPSQREFLLDKSCKYKLISRKENIIELEVIL